MEESIRTSTQITSNFSQKKQDINSTKHPWGFPRGHMSTTGSIRIKMGFIKRRTVSGLTQDGNESSSTRTVDLWELCGIQKGRQVSRNRCHLFALTLSLVMARFVVTIEQRCIEVS